MQKFERKDMDQIIADAKEAGMQVDTSEYDRGSDFYTIDGEFAGNPLKVIVSGFNGRFIVPKDGEMYTERNAEMDGTDWYDAILALIYGPAIEAA